MRQCISPGDDRPHTVYRYTDQIYKVIQWYYKYFDSWEVDRLPELPASYQPYAVNPMEIPVFRRRLRLGRWLFKEAKKIRKKNRRAPKVAAVVDFMNLPEPEPEVTYAAG